MAVFNCSTYEADEINDTGTENETVDFKVQTQTNNLYTGGFSVTDTLKIKGINGVNVVASDDTIVIGVNGTGSTGGGTSGGDTGNSGVDTTALELSVEALGQSVEALGESVESLGQSVETLNTDLQDLSERVSDLEQSVGDTTELEKTVDQHTTQIGDLNNTLLAQAITLVSLGSEVKQNGRDIEDLQSNTGYGTGSGLPEATEADNGKVLGVVNGKIAWVEPTGGSGCNCPAIYTANSVEELPDPATVPQNSIGLVPSKNEDSGDTDGDSGGDTGGDSGSESSGAVLPVVELTTTITMCSSSITSAVTTLNNTDQAAIDAAADTGLPVLIKAKSDAGLDFSVIGNNTGGSYFECGYCLTFAKAVVAYDGGTKKWEFRLTYVGS